ncbi:MULTISPECIES: OmpA family protein [unclassified Mesorhizobium]|uniref:OmpA family protein n=1 Tax=unclassified Mesorhizobium TaxID=325217 RepID=UPI000FD5F2FC|nr:MULTISPECIES: OmpA family protein [unclassified Mesorhizobium]RVB89610.1 flagellar motor protein MotB [Mesorhizobium sp. M7A.F.Ca.AU.002.04.1.1]TPJ21797.1 flagellar motor protein MotB [Mesorhizobium sp. B2-8-4]
MKRQPRILAGTALGLLMASAPLGAFPLQGSVASGLAQRTATPFILAQAACAEGESAEACAQKQQAEPEQKHERKKAEPEQQAAPAQSEQPAEEQQPRRKKRDQQQQAEQAPAEQAAPAEEQQPRRKKRDQQQQAEQAPAEQAAPAEEQQPRRKKRDQQQQTEQAPAEQAAPAGEQQPRRKKRDQQQQTEQAPAEQAAPAGEQQPRRKKRDQQQQTEQTPAEQVAPANDNQPGEQAQPRKKNRQDQQAQPEVAPTPKEAPAGEATAPAGEQPAAQGEQPQDTTKKHGRKPVGEQPATAEQPTTGEQPANGQTAAPAQGENPVQGEAPADPNAAPILDSQKDVERRGGGRKRGDKNAQQDGEQQNGGQNAQQGGDQGRKPVAAPVDQGPPPTDDRAAQQEIKPEKIVPVTEEKGTRVERAPDEIARDRRRPKGVDVVRKLGDRVILQFNNQTFVQSNDAPRVTRGAKEVYYEDLSGDRTREIVERDNGVRIVTIRNRYGDVIQRSRIAPDGREYVLSYVDERHYQDDSDWRDPGDDLPPMRLTIPRREYILDSEDVESPDDYYEFLEQPPVEKVQRLYSIDEVKRSARVRDIARRVDLDTLNFEFGSASISDTEVQKLEGVATAMEKLLKKNPAETFLIEGHTDAVGTPEANLALSDRRAEAVAEALTNAFGIPPENLTTQGYGEEYLKVNTAAPNRENRRVAIRRITSLVAPVASNN